MKSLTDLQRDMSSLYEELRTGKLDLKLASELANIAGKNLKAKQLELAERIFMNNKAGDLNIIEADAKIVSAKKQSKATENA